MSRQSQVSGKFFRTLTLFIGFFFPTGIGIGGDAVFAIGLLAITYNSSGSDKKEKDRCLVKYNIIHFSIFSHSYWLQTW